VQLLLGCWQFVVPLQQTHQLLALAAREQPILLLMWLLLLVLVLLQLVLLVLLLSRWTQQVDAWLPWLCLLLDATQLHVQDRPAGDEPFLLASDPTPG
jgi:hypothetical protein